MRSPLIVGLAVPRQRVAGRCGRVTPVVAIARREVYATARTEAPPARKAVLAQGPGETSAIQNGFEGLRRPAAQNALRFRDVVTIRQRHRRLGQIALLDSDDDRTDAPTTFGTADQPRIIKIS